MVQWDQATQQGNASFILVHIPSILSPNIEQCNLHLSDVILYTFDLPYLLAYKLTQYFNLRSSKINDSQQITLFEI